MIVIGFSGRKRHGKDTGCDAIIKARGAQSATAYHHLPILSKLLTPPHDIRKFGFGDLVRDELAYHYPNTMNRKIQQNWGASRREEYSRYWVLKMDAIVLHYRPEVALISGIRFDDEYDWLKAYGGYLIHVVREGFTDPEPGTDDITEQFDGKKADYMICVRDGHTKQLGELAVVTFDEIMKERMG